MEELKKYLLEKTGLDAGHTGIFLDSATGKLISYSGEEVGITDKDGSSFYIRERGDQSYRVIQKDTPKIIETIQDYRLVAFAKSQPDKVRECLLNALFFYKNIQVTASSVNAGQIISQEYPRKKEAERLSILQKLSFGSIVSVDFRMGGEMVPNGCECKICGEC